MKAKDYHNIYLKGKEKNFRTVEITTDILLLFKGEIYEMISKRNCKSDSACMSVIIELNNKWICFVNLCQDVDIHKGMFVMMIATLMPELYSILPPKVKAEWV